MKPIDFVLYSWSSEFGSIRACLYDNVMPNAITDAIHTSSLLGERYIRGLTVVEWRSSTREIRRLDLK